MTQSYRDAGCKGNTNIIKNVTLKGERYCQDYTDVGGYDDPLPLIQSKHYY